MALNNIRSHCGVCSRPRLFTELESSIAGTLRPVGFPSALIGWSTSVISRRQYGYRIKYNMKDGEAEEKPSVATRFFRLLESAYSSVGI